MLNVYIQNLHEFKALMAILEYMQRNSKLFCNKFLIFFAKSAFWMMSK